MTDSREFSLDVYPDTSGKDIFVVRTRTTVPVYGCSEVEVRRKLSDFKWLHSTLLEEYPGTAIPPVVEKSDISGTNYFLRRFLRRTVLHPSLHESWMLRIFLEGSDAELSAARKKGGNAFFKFFKKLGEDFTDFDSYEEQNPHLKQHKRVVNTIGQHLKQGWTSASEVVQNQSNISKAYSGLSSAIKSLSATETDTNTAEAASRVGYALEQGAELNSLEARYLNTHLGDLLDDGSRVASSVSRIFDARRRDYMQQKQIISKCMNLEEKLSIMRADDVSPLDRDYQSIESSLEKVRMEHDQFTERVDKTTTTIDSELDRFKIERFIDIRASLLRLVKSQINVYTDAEANWRNLLSELSTTQTQKSRATKQVIVEDDSNLVLSAVSEVSQELADNMKEAADNMKEAAGYMKEKTIEGVSFMKDGAVDGASFLRDGAVEGVSFMKQGAIDSAMYVKEGAKESASFLKEGVDIMKDNVAEVTGAAGDKIRQFKENMSTEDVEQDPLKPFLSPFEDGLRGADSDETVFTVPMTGQSAGVEQSWSKSSEIDLGYSVPFTNNIGLERVDKGIGRAVVGEAMSDRTGDLASVAVGRAVRTAATDSATSYGTSVKDRVAAGGAFGVPSAYQQTQPLTQFKEEPAIVPTETITEENNEPTVYTTTVSDDGDNADPFQFPS